MNIQEIINNLDKSKPNSCYINSYTLLSELGLGVDYIDTEPSRLSCYFYLDWLCTDTRVGGRLYFLDDEFVAYSWQKARKSDEIFKWKDKESFDKTYNYINSLINRDSDVTYMQPDDWEQEWKKGYPVEYEEQILTKKVIYKPSGEYVTIIHTYSTIDDSDKWGKVLIKFDTGEELLVTTNYILIPYNTIDKNEN